MTRILLVSLSLALTGCTLDAGNWFSTLDAEIEARFETPESRDAGDDWHALDDDYDLRFDGAAIELGNIELLASTDAAGDDGGPSTRVAVSLPVGDVDLLDGARSPLDCVLSCGLPRLHLVRARVVVRSVAFEGRVRDGGSEMRIAESAWRWEERLDVTEQPVLDIPLDVVVDRASPPEIALLLSVAVSSRLFDGIDWSSIPEVDGVRDVAATGGDAVERLHAALRELALVADVER